MRLVRSCLKALAGLILLLVVVFFAGVYWPLDRPEPPPRHDQVLLTNVAVVDVRSGDILSPRDVLISLGRIISVGVTSSFAHRAGAAVRAGC